MSADNLPNISIGDFAMDILNEMANDPRAVRAAIRELPTSSKSDAPDVSQIEVTNEFVSLITESRGSPKPKQSKPQAKIVESKEVRLGNLVSQLSSLLTEARQIIEDLSPGMTSCGNIGVNTLGKKKPKKSDKLSKLKLKFGIK